MLAECEKKQGHKRNKNISCRVPLYTPFKTALRTVTTAETAVVKLVCDNGITGWGEATPTHVITGESLSSIEFSIHHCLNRYCLGRHCYIENDFMFTRFS
jgi:L-Ala-D/L-Glu epimerase